MATVALTKGYTTEIDDADLPLISGFRWKALEVDGFVYAARNKKIPGTRKSRVLLMHRVLMNPPSDKIVDHINGDSLDNRRENLRVGTQSGNLANMRKTRGVSKYKGVYWNKERRKWQAQIRCGGDGRTIYLGRFDSEDDAARAYNAKALDLHGEWARLNDVNDVNDVRCPSMPRSVVQKPPGWTPPDIAGVLARFGGDGV